MQTLKTNEALLRALKVAALAKLTAEEIHRQRVSFIMGSLKETSGATRAQVESVLKEQEGRKISDPV